MENRLVEARSWGYIGLEKGGYGDKRATLEIFVVLELFSILIVVVGKGVYSDNTNV